MIMKINDLTCELNMPDAVQGEIVNGLPPYARVSAYAVDEYPACPDNWMHGSSKASSYFVPVKEGKGLWLDFNGCQSHKYDVAIVVSIQGVNPITGQKQDQLGLEQYKDKCPLHSCDFEQDRFCPQCKFKWPGQNYISTTGTPWQSLWIDGFRTEDGKVRQYILTAEKMKGVAAQLIGKDRVFAIGVAFFLSKMPKPVLENPILTRGTSSLMTFDSPQDYNMYYSKTNYTSKIGAYQKCNAKGQSVSDNIMRSLDLGYMLNNDMENIHPTNEVLCAAAVTDTSLETKSQVRDRSSKSIQKKLEIGAGGLIAQQIHVDPKDINYWEDTPAGFIYLNYVSQEECQQILNTGKREEKKEGAFDGLQLAK
jgi:hypothetical protein